MCGVEIISLKSANCAWVQTTDHHIWQMFTYHLCPTGAVRHCPCDNVQPVGGQTENDIGSLRMTACPVCTKLDAAERACVEAKRLADEEYARAWTAAQKEERHIYPLSPQPEPSRNRDGRERRRDDRHDSDRQHGDGGRGKHYDRERYRYPEEKGKKYYE